MQTHDKRIAGAVGLWMLSLVVVQAAALGYRGVNSSGSFPASGLLKSWPKEGPPLLWKYDVGIGYAGVTVTNGRVYVAGGVLSHLYVFDLDGRLESRIRIGGAGFKRFSGTRSTPLVEGTLVLTTTPDANCYAVDMAKQAVTWRVNVWHDFAVGKGNEGWGYPSTPILWDGKLIFNTCSRHDDQPPVLALDLHDRSRVWAMDAGKGKAYSAADVSMACFNHNGRQLLVCPTWCYVVCLDAKTGETLWEIPSCGEKTLTPVYSADGYLLVGLRRQLDVEPVCEEGVVFDDLSPRQKMNCQRWGDEEMVMLRLNEDGTGYQVLWTGRRAPPRYSHAVILNKHLYCFGNPGETQEPTPDGVLPLLDPEARGGKKGGTSLLCLDAETGALIHHEPAGTAGHVITADGMVYAVDLVSNPSREVPMPRVWLVQPEAHGFEIAGRFEPDLSDDDVALRDIEWQASACPVVADGRLFVRYGPLLAYELRPDRVEVIRNRATTVNSLIEQFAGADSASRRKAGLALKELGWQAAPAAHVLIQALSDDDPTIRELSGEILPALGPSIADGLVKAMRDERVRDDGYAASALRLVLKRESVADALVEAAAFSRGIRQDVKELLPLYGADCVPGLRRVLDKGDRIARWWAIEVIRDMGPLASEAVPDLAAETKSENIWFAALAAEALCRIGPAARDAVPELTALLGHGYSVARKNAADALASIGESSPQVLQALGAAAERARSAAAESANAEDAAREQAALDAALAAIATLTPSHSQ